MSHSLNHNFIYLNALTRFRFTTVSLPDSPLGLNFSLIPAYVSLYWIWNASSDLSPYRKHMKWMEVADWSVVDSDRRAEVWFKPSAEQKQAWAYFPPLLMSRTLLLQPIMTSCYSLLEQYITRFDLSFELMLNELCLLLSQTQNSSPWSN